MSMYNLMRHSDALVEDIMYSLHYHHVSCKAIVNKMRECDDNSLFSFKKFKNYQDGYVLDYDGYIRHEIRYAPDGETARALLQSIFRRYKSAYNHAKAYKSSLSKRSSRQFYIGMLRQGLDSSHLDIIKIGVSKNPGDIIKRINKYSPYAVELIYKTPCSLDTLTALRKIINSYCMSINNDYFVLNDRLLYELIMLEKHLLRHCEGYSELQF